MLLAYIDGGMGSMALQIILASGLSAIYAIHTRWALLKAKFSRKSAVSAVQKENKRAA